jgi:hypothetical protein
MLVEDRAASTAAQERPAFLDGEKGNKEKAQIMVRPLKVQGQAAAIGTRSCLFIQGDCSRSDASDEENITNSDQTLPPMLHNRRPSSLRPASGRRPVSEPNREGKRPE